MAMVSNIVGSTTSDHPDELSRCSVGKFAPFLPQGEGMVTRHVECRLADVVYVKSIASAYDGLCCLFCERGATLQLLAPSGQEAELDLFIADLEDELVLKRLGERRVQI